MEGLTIAQKPYQPRVVDKQLAAQLQRAGAVVIRDPKWCGKTETAYHQSNSAIFMKDPDERAKNLAAAETKSSLLLRGEKPRLIDEWQEAPVLWDAVRFAVDRADGPGQFLLTGSVVPGEKPHHTGAGRFSFLDMLPMTLFESSDSTGEVSLKELFGGIAPQGNSNLDVEDIAYLVCRGGWPRSVLEESRDAALGLPRDYLAAVAEEDVSEVDGVTRNAQYARLIMAEYARCTSMQATMERMRKDIKVQGGYLSRDTVLSYIGALRKLFVIQDLPAWSPSLRARTRVSSTPTRHFACPSIAAAALGAGPEHLLRDIPTLGLLFESLCVRDLRVYASAMDGHVRHYHDASGLEADTVVELADGSYALFEVKLSDSRIDEGAASLLKLTSKIDSDIAGAPAFCTVVVPGGFAYTRQDGVHVVPISCLRP